MNSESNTTNVSEEPDYAQAFNKVQPEMAALDPSVVLAVNIDVADGISTVLGRLPAIQALRPAVVKELPFFEIRFLDDLELYAVALSYCNAAFVTAAEARDGLQAIGEEAAVLRNNLHADVHTLCVRGVVNPDRIKGFNGLNGYRNEALDLQIVTKVLRDYWPEIQGKCFTTMGEIERAEKLALRILRLTGLREQAPGTPVASFDDRARAFTLFVRTYDHVRRAVGYLRWLTDDADTIAPSLYAGRKRKSSKSDMSQAAAPAGSDAAAQGATVVTPAPNPTGAPTSPVTVATKGLKTPVPGSNPFMD